MKKYELEKQKARQQAINWQYNFSNNNYFASELAFFTNHFTKLGKKYGLLKEFRENGII